MKYSRILFIAFFSFMIVNPVLAEIKEVEAVGHGDDRDLAILNALENAVRQTSTVKIVRDMPQVNASVKSSSEVDMAKEGILFDNKSLKGTLEEKVQIKMDMINATYKGTVKSYDVIEEKKEKKNYIVKVKARVDVIDDEYKSPSLVKKADYKMVIMPFDGDKSYRCSGSSISLDKINESLHSRLINKFSKTKKFSIVDRKNLDKHVQEALLIAYDLSDPKEIKKLQKIAAADYMVVGSIEEMSVNTKTETIEVLNETTKSSRAKLIVNYQVIEFATTEIVFSETAEVRFKREDKGITCNKAMERLTNEITDTIVKDTMAELFPDFEYVAKKKPAKVKKTTIHDAPKKKQVIKLPFD